MIYLMTGSDENYYPKILPYLETLQKYSDFRNVLLAVGFQPPADCPVDWMTIPREALTDITTNPCVQAGEFLPYCEKFLNDDDIIIFTDGDIRLQREFTEEELAMVSSLVYGQVLAGPNATHNQNTLYNEAQGLRRHCSDEYLNKAFDYAGITPFERTLNVGVVICTAATYRTIYHKTYDIYRTFPDITNHMARQQWYINLAIYSFCEVTLLPFTFHSHPHNGDQLGMRFDPDGTMYIRDTKVLFRHKYYV